MSSKTKIVGSVYAIGRVLIGPKKVSGGYARIVSAKDGCGCIESFNVASRTWSKAPESLTFDEVWRAPLVPPSDWALIQDKP